MSGRKNMMGGIAQYEISPYVCNALIPICGESCPDDDRGFFVAFFVPNRHTDTVVDLYRKGLKTFVRTWGLEHGLRSATVFFCAGHKQKSSNTMSHPTKVVLGYTHSPANITAINSFFNRVKGINIEKALGDMLYNGGKNTRKFHYQEVMQLLLALEPVKFSDNRLNEY